MASPLITQSTLSSSTGATLKTAGLVLAGGQSRRMGQNKALLRVADDGPTLLEHMQQLLRQVGCSPVLVSGAAIGGIPDRVVDAGPLAGIDATLQTLAECNDIAQLLIVPVDMPGLTQTILRTLLASGDGRHAVHFQHTPLPLLLPNSKSTLAVVQEHLMFPSTRSLQAMARALGVCILTWPDSVPASENLNTPADWQLWLARKQAKPDPEQESP